MNFISNLKLFYDIGVSAALILPLYLVMQDQKNVPDTKLLVQKEYDYIIVGAGAAGSALAGRLSEESCASVLLLEAGGRPPHLDDVPAFGRLFWFTPLDWQYKTEPQKWTGDGLKDRKVIWPGGKGIGGSTLINAMLAVRGSRDNYDDWGLDGWRYDDLYPYFLKLEDNKEPEFLANGYHNKGGPVTIERRDYSSKTRAPFLEGAQQMGYKITDSNGARMTGIYDYAMTTRGGERCSAAKAYLVPADDRKNLDIVAKARVTKVLIEDKRATGVEFHRGLLRHTVKARKEVIVSAGVVNTAQILLLSGVGPKAHLDDLKIPVVADLPVGENFHDHCTVPVFYELNHQDPDFRGYFRQYIHNKTGYLAAAEGLDPLIFVNTRNDSTAVDKPNIELYFALSYTLIARYQFGISKEVDKQVFRRYDNETLYMCFSSQVQPRSRGTVKLKSTNPYDPPLIDPHYLEHPDDLEDIVAGMKLCDALATSEPMRRAVGSKPLTTVYPGCEGMKDDEYRVCMAKSVVVTLSHPAGTAKMGDPGDPTTVVDTKLRVKGIAGLRVVDNSIMPVVTSGNTMLPAIMIGERAADLIKDDLTCG